MGYFRNNKTFHAPFLVYLSTDFQTPCINALEKLIPIEAPTNMPRSEGR